MRICMPTALKLRHHRLPAFTSLGGTNCRRMQQKNQRIVAATAQNRTERLCLLPAAATFLRTIPQAASLGSIPCHITQPFACCVPLPSQSTRAPCMSKCVLGLHPSHLCCTCCTCCSAWRPRRGGLLVPSHQALTQAGRGSSLRKQTPAQLSPGG